MKKKKNSLWFLGLFVLVGSGFAQEETFRFKLYMESANGKKDTLELGVGPDGYGEYDCDYDTGYSEPVFEPFSDTAEHIGAFVVPYLNYGNWDDWHEWDDPIFNRVACPAYFKKRIGRLAEDITIVVPVSAQPVKISWDLSLLQSPIVAVPFLTTMYKGDRFDDLWGENWRGEGWSMARDSYCILDYSRMEEYYHGPATIRDSLYFCTYIQDSSGKDHAYLHFYIILGFDVTSNAEFTSVSPVQISPNPVKDRFCWQSTMPLTEWKIYSMDGRLVEQGNNTVQEIDSNDWSSGLYIFRWRNNNENQGYLKLIKN